MAAVTDPDTARADASFDAAGEAVVPDAAQGWREYAAVFAGPPLVMAVTLAAVLAPSILVPYAFADDYSYLWMAVSGEANPQFGGSVFEAHAVNGRPLTGLLMQLTFGAASSIEQLRLVRIAGVLGVIAFGLLTQWALTRARIRPWPAALIALLMCTMPAFQVYGSWTVLFAAPHAAVLGGVASLVLTRTVGEEGSDRVSAMAIGALLLLGGLLIYQPAAMCFWVFLAIAVVGARDDPRRAWTLAWQHGAVAAAALLMAYLELRLTIAYYGDAVVEASQERAQISTDVVGRLRWFIEQPLMESLNLFHLGPWPWPWLAALVVAGAACGVMLWVFMRTSRPWLYLAIAVALLPVSHLTNIVVEEEQHPYRTQAALSSLTALYLGLSVIGAWSVAGDSLRRALNWGEWRLARTAVWGASIAVVALSCLFAASNVSNLMAAPQMTELRMYRAQVRAIPADAERVSFVQTSWYQGITRRFYNDEYGVPTTARPFALVGSFKLLLREQGKLGPDRRGPTVEYFPSEVGALPAGQPAIDLRGMSHLR
ncbi:MAG: glucosyltransferase domain-containing protein [Dehalococcoidia bacterium]